MRVVANAAICSANAVAGVIVVGVADGSPALRRSTELTSAPAS
jgi:hypothetical protein